MSSKTGKSLTGIEHLTQSIGDLLTTPIGSRVMRRDYGSRIPFLIDRPLDARLISNIRAAVAEVLSAYEPRFRLSRVVINRSDSKLNKGCLSVDLEGYYAPTRQYLTLTDIKL